MIKIITGNKEIGKTTLLSKLIKEHKKKGSPSLGIITPAIYDKSNNKVGFYALNILNNEQWELGRSDKPLRGPSYGSFYFSEAGFTRANKILELALSNGLKNVFLDEIGPLEMEKGSGFFPVLSLISNFNTQCNLYLVIRQGLIEKFVSKFILTKEYRIIEVNSKNRNITGIF